MPDATLYPIAPPPTSATDIAKQLAMYSQMAYRQLLDNYTRSYNLVWHNPTFTPDQVVAALGTSAVKLFTLSALTAQLLAAAGATAIPLTMPAGWNYQAHDDGSVALTPAA